MVAHSIGGEYMADTIEVRACELAVYMIETGATVRAAAQHFGISKSTVHKDLSQRLPQYNKLLCFLIHFYRTPLLPDKNSLYYI